MAPRSKILKLPEDVRRELERRLVAGGFGDYEGLAAWLAEQGYAIGKSTIHRFGSQFEERLGALKIASEQARAVVAQSPDDEGAMNEALVRLVQERLFGVLMELQVDPETLDLPKLARAIADLSRSTVQLKKYRAEVQAKAQDVASKVARMSRTGGLSEDTAEVIRKEILGIA